MTYNIPLDVKVVDPSTTSNSGVPRDVRIVDADGNAAGLIFDNLTATTDPAVTDDSDSNYSIGSRWVNVTSDTAYICLDATVGAAVWQIIGGVADALSYKGTIDCAANPNYPAGDAGDVYKISVAGKIGGASGENVEAGDMIICNTDGSAGGTEASVGDEWDTIQTNIDGAVTGPSSSTDEAVARFDSTTGKIIQDSSLLVSDTGSLTVWRKDQLDVGIYFRTSSETSYYIKNAIIIDATGSYARGSMNFCSNNAATLTSATLSDMVFKVEASGLTGNTGKVLSFDPDGDTTHTLGRAKIGYVGDVIRVDRAYFSHYDRMSYTNFALMQMASGETWINASSGKDIKLANGSGTVVNINTTGLTSSAGRVLSFDADGDTCHVLGRGKLGYDGATADEFSISHYDQMSLNSKGFRQDANGKTTIQSASGQDLVFRRGGSMEGYFGASGFYCSNGAIIASTKTLSFSDGGSVDIIRDEDTMSSDDENALATQQSIKAYVDSAVGGISGVETVNLADDATEVLTTGVVGILEVWEATEHLRVHVAADGTITLIYGSSNTDTADTDATLCVYDGGTGAVIKNRLGSTKDVYYMFNHS